MQTRYQSCFEYESAHKLFMNLNATIVESINLNFLIEHTMKLNFLELKFILPKEQIITDLYHENL